MSVNASLCLVLRLMSFGSHARIPFEFTPLDTLKILAGGEVCARKFASAAEMAGDELPLDGDLRRTPANQRPVCLRSFRKLQAVGAPGSATPKMHVRLRTSCAPTHASHGSTTPACDRCSERRSFGVPGKGLGARP